VVLEVGPSEWAVQRFGERYAERLWTLIPTALAAAVSRQIDTHQASGLRSLHAYGGAWPAQYEELVTHVGGLDGVEVVRPSGLAVHLVVVNGHLLVPFRYADDLTTSLTDPSVTQRLNKTCRTLLGRLGPDPDTEQLTLFDDLFPAPDTDAASGAKLLGDVKPDGMVLVFFSANADAGLLEVGWGDAALPSDGSLRWKHSELLPLPKTPLAGSELVVAGLRRPTGADRGAGGRRFDEAPQPDPALTPRTPTKPAEVTESSSEQPLRLPLAGDE
jgi:hypothetical protein